MLLFSSLNIGRGSLVHGNMFVIDHSSHMIAVSTSTPVQIKASATVMVKSCAGSNCMLYK